MSFANTIKKFLHVTWNLIKHLVLFKIFPWSIMKKKNNNNKKRHSKHRLHLSFEHFDFNFKVYRNINHGKRWLTFSSLLHCLNYSYWPLLENLWGLEWALGRKCPGSCLFLLWLARGLPSMTQHIYMYRRQQRNILKFTPHKGRCS